MREANIISPLRTVLRWQLVATAALTLLAGVLAGAHGAVSAALGGAVSVGAGWAAARVASDRPGKKSHSAKAGLTSALKAEGVKLGVIVVLLWLVLAAYPDVVMAAFFGTMMATVLVFSMAFFVREHLQE